MWSLNRLTAASDVNLLVGRYIYVTLVVWPLTRPRSRVGKLIVAFEARGCDVLSGCARLYDLDR